MGARLIHGVSQVQQQTVAMHVELQRHWDGKLNYQWALAPVDVELMTRFCPWILTKKIYRQQNRVLGKFCSKYLAEELKRAHKDLGAQLAGHTIAMFGLGLGRDLSWVKKANKLGLSVHGYDISSVGCHSGKHLERVQLPGINNIVYQAEVEDLLRKATEGEGDLDFSRTLAVYMGQFLQVLGVEARLSNLPDPGAKMRRIMHMLGKFIALPGRRVIIAHPFGNDNDKPTQWMGVNFFSGAQWGDSVPFSLADLVTPLEQGLQEENPKASVGVSKIHKVGYFHQVYSAFTLKAVHV